MSRDERRSRRTWGGMTDAERERAYFQRVVRILQRDFRAKFNGEPDANFAYGMSCCLMRSATERYSKFLLAA